MTARLEKLRGIILKRVNIGESDRFVTAFTREEGKITFKAPGVRRINSRRAPHLETFNEVELSIHHSTRTSLVTEALTINRFANLRLDLYLVGLAYYLVEVIDKLLPERQPNERIYELLITTAHQLDKLVLDDKDEEKNESGRRIVKEFIVQLVWELGFLPRGEYPKEGLTLFVEEIAERKIKSRKFLEEI